jgi:ABC-type lipoprotein release transport system permease subunit
MTFGRTGAPGLTALALGLVGFAAVAVPARRAARTPPAAVLRED